MADAQTYEVGLTDISTTYILKVYLVVYLRKYAAFVNRVYVAGTDADGNFAQKLII
jgi:hypothetical protein